MDIVFCADYYLDIDESDLITKLFKAISYVNSTRTDDYFYSALNEETTRINGDIITVSNLLRNSVTGII